MRNLNDHLDVLRCPETGARLRLAAPDLVEELNDRVRTGNLRDISGEPVHRPLDAALEPEGEAFVYPVRDGIPDFLLDDRILTTSK